MKLARHLAGSMCGNCAGLATQNLNPDVLMMEPAQDWYRGDAADLLTTPKIWSIIQ